MTDTLTSTGLTIRTLSERIALIKASLRSAIAANLDLSSDQPDGQFVEILAEAIQQLAELSQEVHGAFDPDQATGLSLTALSLITGTLRRVATYGTVTLDLDLDATTTVPAGTIFAVSGEPDNQWILDSAVTSVGAGTYQGTATASQSGAIPALATTISVIVTPVAGLNSVDNPTDATAGLELETDTALRLRREVEVEQGGSASVDSIQAALSEITEVLEVIVLENERSRAADGMPPHSIEPVIWTGGTDPAASVLAEIASTIFSEKASGVQSYGTNTNDGDYSDPLTRELTQTHTDTQGNEHEIGWTLAEGMRVELEYTLVTDSNYPGDAAFQAAVAAWDDSNLSIGEDVLHARFIANAFDVDGVVNVTLLRLRFFGGAWGTSDLTITNRQKATISSGDITVI